MTEFENDVFIGYASEDRALAKQLARDLEARGVTVWWDTELIGGEKYHAVIADRIDTARKVVVLWTENSVGSGFVIDEANRGNQQDKLVPVEVDATEAPMGYGNLNKLRLSRHGWDIERIYQSVKPPEPEPVEAEALPEETVADSGRESGSISDVLFGMAAIVVLVLAFLLSLFYS